MGDWTREEEEFLIKKYKKDTFFNIASKLGRSLYSIKAKSSKLGLVKKPQKCWTEKEIKELKELYPCNTSSYLQEHFKRGVRSINSKARVLGLNKTDVSVINNTKFKKGNIPNRTKSLASIRFNKDFYIEIKINQPNEWILFSHYIYMLSNKIEAIPEGYCVTFKDGNKLNYSPVNLILKKRSEMLRENKENSVILEIKKLIKKIDEK